MRPLKRKIDADALRHNWRAIRKRATAKKILAVIKSDAYGHGLQTAAGALEKEVDGFAVAEINDAQKLRRRGVEKPILLLGGMFAPSDIKSVAALNLMTAVRDWRQIKFLTAADSSAKLTVFLKINGDMNRLGFCAPESAAALSALKNIKAVKKIVLMTHFARADSPRGLMQPLQTILPFRRPGMEMSLGNSAATLLHDDIGDDWARVGIALYGSSPSPGWQNRDELKLTAAMTLQTKIIAARQIKKGDTAGYGGQWRAKQETKIGVAACGYGDGYPRMPGGVAMIINSRKVLCPILPPVSMELMLLDLTNAPNAKIGDTVELWGKSLSVDEAAKQCGKISYELLTAAGQRR